MKRIKSKPGKDGLSSKVLKLNGIVKTNEKNKRYIPFCINSFHYGIILDEYVCQERKCMHYRRFYEK